MEEDESKKRTLKRDNALLREFDDSASSDLLVLYHHARDMAFDCFNANEYHQQMLRYYAAEISLKLVVPRRINQNDYLLVCLQYNQADHPGNTLCEVAFQCMRQFCGISMLVKKRCFVCNKAGAKTCTACHCACFCSRECQARGWEKHKQLCKLVDSSKVVTETECISIELE